MESRTCTASEQAFSRLSDILDTLRKECPWDKVQTMKSLRYLTIEEVHELSEAIVAMENGDTAATSDLKKELGDVAMHILFYCKIAEEQGLFSTADVYNTICDKLIARHPFIYRKDEYHGESWEQLEDARGAQGCAGRGACIAAVARQSGAHAGEGGRHEQRQKETGCTHARGQLATG